MCLSLGRPVRFGMRKFWWGGVGRCVQVVKPLYFDTGWPRSEPRRVVAVCIQHRRPAAPSLLERINHAAPPTVGLACPHNRLPPEHVPDRKPSRRSCCRENGWAYRGSRNRRSRRASRGDGATPVTCRLRIFSRRGDSNPKARSLRDPPRGRPHPGLRVNIFSLSAARKRDTVRSRRTS
jgi:hypothetical protein